jgi:hypothetical protein
MITVYHWFGADLAARRPANPTTLCDRYDVSFVAAAGQILMTVHTGERRAAREPLKCHAG